MSIAEKLQTIAENEQKVYDKGYFNGNMVGLDQGYAQGFEEGKSLGFNEGYDMGGIDARTELWNAVQQNGNRTNYEQAFRIWNLEGIRPLYDMKAKNCGSMFRSTHGNPTDLAQAFEECGVTLDTSGAAELSWMFAYSDVTHIPVIDLTLGTSLSGMFYSCPYLTKIDKLILKSDGTQIFTAAFGSLEKLTEITIEGVIGRNEFDIHWSTLLTEASLTSIVNALSTTTTGLTITLPLAAVKREFGKYTDDGNGVLSAEWALLTSEHTNWNISLV